MVVVKKSNESGGAPSLDILAAKLRVVEAEFFAEPYEVNLDNGRCRMHGGRSPRGVAHPSFTDLSTDI